MGLMTPILAAYIAQSIGNRPALVSGFVAGLMASNGGAGFLGGIIGGFFAGYLVVLLENYLKNYQNTRRIKSYFPLSVIRSINHWTIYEYYC